jgi:hypothetical protein
LVLESNVLELNRTGKMEKEYVFSPSGAKLAYLKDNEVIWMHSEPSGKESYEIKQDRTATKATYDPTGAAVTNFGYTGGAACPPNTCNSGYNSQIIGAWTFIDGLFILSQQRNAERLQSRQFEILKLGFLGIRQGTIPGSNQAHPPPGTQPENDPFKSHTYGTNDIHIFDFFIIGSVEVVPLGNVEKEAQKLISENKECSNFINNLLKKVAETTGRKSVANPFEGNVVDFSTQTYRTKDGKLGYAAGKAYGRFFTLPDSNGRRESFGLIGISPKDVGFIYAAADYIADYIHEAIHNASISGTYSDQELAAASFDSVVRNGKPLYGLPNNVLEEYEKTKKENTTEGYSNFYDKVLQYFCPGADGRRTKRF